MGVDSHVLRLLSESRKKGVSFSSTVMLGRQKFLGLKPADLARELGIASQEAEALYAEDYSESLFKRLGADRLDSMDFSTYENATIAHDLNLPVPESLKGRFSLVFDGGTTEHVFNFPQAIKNCMEMVEVGGHFVGVTTANNFMGHGFYQFSPELFFRVFSPENGYRVESMILCETDWGSPWYQVDDPDVVGRRVVLVNNRPTYIMVIAKRVSEANIFANTPQQSDYVSSWGLNKKAEPAVSRPPTAFEAGVRSVKSMMTKVLPRGLETWVKRLTSGRLNAFPSDSYRKV